MGKRRQAIRNKKPATGQKPEARNQEPETSGQGPETSDQRPEASHQRPETRNRPFIIPIFLPHAGCPHRCVFCDQTSITGLKKKLLTTEDVRARVEAFLNYNRKQRQPVQIAFFGGNFLGQAPEVVKKMLAEATSFVRQGRAHRIRFSTRPDTIDRRRLETISAFPVSTIELGVQSMHDGVLAASRRGHTQADTVAAVKLLKESDYEIGLQIMVGLPGDDYQQSMQTGRLITNLRPDFVRIYPTVVLNHSPLAGWYHHEAYVPLPLEAAVRQVKDLFLMFRSNGIKIIRMGLQHSLDFDNSETILAGPYHPAFGHLVYSEIFLDNAILAIKSEKIKGGTVAIRVHPNNVSKMRGQKNDNIKTLKRQFHFNAIDIIPDATIAADKLMVIEPVKSVQ
jgi:histone acetyltransferase (RNA polymerase elongator complex component)